MTTMDLYHGTRVQAGRSGAATAVIELGNPPGGMMDETMERELGEAVAALEAAAGLAVVIVTGSQPGVFVRHYDVAVLEQRARQMQARAMRFSLERPVRENAIHRCISAIEASSRVYIAAINGVAMGGGFELALGCDLRVAQAGDYPIGLPEINLGILPGAGGTQRLTRLIGPARALELLLQGRTLDPEQAERYGLVNACCSGPARAHALEWAQTMAALHPRALAHIKQLVRSVGSIPPHDGYANERTLFCDLMVDARSIELMAQFNRGERPITGR